MTIDDSNKYNFLNEVANLQNRVSLNPHVKRYLVSQQIPELFMMKKMKCLIIKSKTQHGHAQMNTHGSYAKRNEFTAPRNSHEKSQTCGNSSKPERRTGQHESFTKQLTETTLYACCRYKDGDLVNNQPEVLSQWAQYFDELLNDQFNEQLEAPLADSVMLLRSHQWTTRFSLVHLKEPKYPSLLQSSTCAT